MKYKRIIAGVLGVLLTATMFSACTSKEKTPANNDNIKPLETDGDLGEMPEDISVERSEGPVSAMSADNSYTGILPVNNRVPAATTNPLTMEESIKLVKQRITIDEAYSEFDYSLSEEYSSNAYTFMWTNPDTMERIEVSVAGDLILNIYIYNNDNTYSNIPKFAQLSNKEMIDTAMAYFQGINPTINSEVRFEISSLSLNQSTATIGFTRYENGIRVAQNGGEISIDKDTGDLKRFSMSWWDKVEFQPIASIKSLEEVQDIYKSDICELTPVYKITKNEDDEDVINIVYSPNTTDEIDAFTGELSSIWDDMNEADGNRFYGHYSKYDMAVNATAEAAMFDSDAGGGLTPAELEKVEINESLLSNDEVKQILMNNKAVKMEEDYVYSNKYIYSNNDKDNPEFYISISFETDNSSLYKNLNATINGKTGEIISFERYSAQQKLPKLDVNTANDRAFEALKILAPDIYTEYRESERNRLQVKTYDNGWYESDRYMLYTRYVNDILVDGDTISITVDSRGTITGYRNGYTKDKSEFPAPNLISAATCLDNLYKNQTFNLYYDGWVDKQGEIQPYVLYKINNFYINALTGKQSNAYGNETNVLDEPANDYNDIDDIPQADKIRELLKYDIRISDDYNLEPNKTITNKEFQKILNRSINTPTPYMMASSYMVAVPNTEEDTEFDIDIRNMTKIFTSVYDPNNLASAKGIWKSPFSDIDDNDEDVGAIAIAYSKNFISGNKLNPDKKVTRAEALEYVYDYIAQMSE